MQIVDRRLNPKSKSLGNRQRFLRRAKAEIRDAIKDSLKSRKVSETEGAEKVTIRSKSLREPSFGLSRNSGVRDYVLPGNEEYQVGDEIPKPQGGAGGRGSQGSPDGEGQDEFTFTLTKEEFLDLFFDDLKLPNLIKVRAQGSQGAQARACGLHHRRASRAAQPHAHHAQEPGAAHGAAAPEPGRDRSARGGDRRRGGGEPRRRDEDRRAQARGSSTSSACAAPSPTSIPSILPTTASSACRSRPRRRSCSA